MLACMLEVALLNRWSVQQSHAVATVAVSSGDRIHCPPTAAVRVAPVATETDEGAEVMATVAEATVVVELAVAAQWMESAAVEEGVAAEKAGLVALSQW